jgi:adenylate cyclase class 2
MEQETKFKVRSWQTASRMMLEVNAQRISERHFENNVMLDYDRNGNSSTPLRNAGQTLRIRTVPGATILTFKGPAKVVGKTKVREEVECIVHHGDNLFKIFKGLGYSPRFRYQKYRAEFALEGAVIALDETPIGCFIEIEGTLKAITKAAKALRLNMKDGISDSYPKLYEQACKKKPALPTFMMFDEYRFH